MTQTNIGIHKGSNRKPKLEKMGRIRRLIKWAHIYRILEGKHLVNRVVMPFPCNWMIIHPLEIITKLMLIVTISLRIIFKCLKIHELRFAPIEIIMNPSVMGQYLMIIFLFYLWLNINMFSPSVPLFSKLFASVLPSLYMCKPNFFKFFQ